jgi:hypothetical protein
MAKEFALLFEVLSVFAAAVSGGSVLVFIFVPVLLGLFVRGCCLCCWGVFFLCFFSVSCSVCSWEFLLLVVISLSMSYT